MKHIIHNPFPVPKTLKMPSAGIDVSDRSLKFVTLFEKGRKLHVKNFGEIILEKGIIEDGEIKEGEKLLKILEDLRKKNKMKYITASLPEERSFVLSLQLPVIEERDLRNTIELQLEEHVPLPVNRIEFDYEVIHAKEKEKHMDVVVHALPKLTVKRYLDILLEAGLKPTMFEIEAEANRRSVIARGDSGTYLIVDFGAVRTSFSIISNEVVWFTSSANIGGENFDYSIMKELKVDKNEAEKLRREQGLIRIEGGIDVYSCLLPIVSVIRDEINKAIIYWNTREAKGDHKKEKLNQIILCGGNSLTPGLTGFLAASIGVNVSFANAWKNILSLEEEIPPMEFFDSLRYTQAIGLALRSHIHV